MVRGRIQMKTGGVYEFRPGYGGSIHNIMEVGGDTTGAFDNVDHESLPRANWTGGSWEGHGVQRSGYNLNVLTKYGKMGGRCAR